eukprot:scaffold230760_cov23-Prasinocladus_malaysianus.AAC.1
MFDTLGCGCLHGSYLRSQVALKWEFASEADVVLTSWPSNPHSNALVEPFASIVSYGRRIYYESEQNLSEQSRNTLLSMSRPTTPSCPRSATANRS